MSRLVEDLLLLARAEHPDFLDAHPIDVGEFTKEVAAKISALSTEREWAVAETASVVMIADRHRLIQALMNLSRNAVENSEAGSSIVLGSRSVNPNVQFWIRDEGVGIALEEQERIFQRFSRGQSGRPRSEGAGLGLAIVKTIVEAHKGRVLVTSSPGKGSKFTLLLPASGPKEIP
jgi:signal transduction histidine kinase